MSGLPDSLWVTTTTAQNGNRVTVPSSPPSPRASAVRRRASVSIFSAPKRSRLRSQSLSLSSQRLFPSVVAMPVARTARRRPARSYRSRKPFKKRTLISRIPPRGRRAKDPVYGLISNAPNIFRRCTDTIYGVLNNIGSGTQYGPAVLTSSTTDRDFYAFVFRLIDIQGYTAFTAMFDQYKILKVMVTIIPRQNVNAPSFTGNVGAPLITVIDHDGFGGLPTSGDLLAYQTCIESSPLSTLRRVVYPSFRSSALDEKNNNSLGSATRQRGWVDCANPNIAWHGLFLMLPQTTTVNLQWDLRMEYYLAFKDVR